MKIEGNFISITSKVRANGSSLIVGLPKPDCKFAGIEKGTMIQIFMKSCNLLFIRYLLSKQSFLLT